ncbi:hybrid sensor histidine kinase/response regulator [Paraburkholderia sp. UCT31]|uniref:ATP-binding response regulator n=1 Tax=Paraburkholderia sp. UCT31 TaxID=2615209 RepID=UPI00223B481D|nr:hybrid sensor histidine kinase/response regulator [Paraburkholderia sp. UCT31]
MKRYLAEVPFRKLTGTFLITGAVLTCGVYMAARSFLVRADAISSSPVFDEDIDWAPAALRRADERLSEGAALALASGQKEGEVLDRFGELEAQVDAFQSADMARRLGSLTAYPEVVAEMTALIADLRSKVEAPDRDALLYIRERVAALIPYLNDLVMQARAKEAEVRMERRGQIKENGNRAFIAIIAGWAVLLALGWIVILRLRADSIALAREKAAHEAVAEAERARHTFIGKVSHEINAPLQSIVTNIQLLEAQLVSQPSFDKTLSRLRTSLDQLRFQVNDLLDLSEIGSGELTLELEPVDVEAVARNVIAVQQLGADSKRISLQLKTENLRRVVTDGRRFSQILTNLVSNSIRYADAGVVSISLSLDALRTNVRLVVADNGCGFAPEVLAKLYQPFTQPQKRRGGTGLGLAIVKGLVEQLGGRIELESQPGQGSRFTIDIPVTEPNASERRLFLESLPPCAAATPANSDAMPSTGDETSPLVLLAESDEVIRETVCDLLKVNGIRCDSVGGAQEAIGRMSQREYGAILINAHLGMPGWISLARSAKKTVNRFAPLVGMATHTQAFDEPGAEIFDARVVAPVDAASLVKLVREQCARDD